MEAGDAFLYGAGLYDPVPSSACIRRRPLYFLKKIEIWGKAQREAGATENAGAENSAVIGAHTLNFKPIFKCSLLQITAPVPGGMCASKPGQFLAVSTLEWQHRHDIFLIFFLVMFS